MKEGITTLFASAPDAIDLLTEEEMEKLTGRSSYARQIEWLNKNSWHYEIRADKRPIVLRSYLVARMMGLTDKC